MARISTYASDTNITDSDKVIGSDAGASNATKNFTVGDLKSHINTGYATEAYADQAEADARAYTDARETAITSAYQSYADQAEADANAYTDTREAAITLAYQTYTDTAESDANTYTDNSIIASEKQKIAAATNSLTVDTSAPSGTNQINTDYDITFKAISVTNDASAGSLNLFPALSPNLTLDHSTGAIQNSSGNDISVKINMSAFTSTINNGTNIIYTLWLNQAGGGYNSVKSVARTKTDPGDHVDSFYMYYRIPADSEIKFTISASKTGMTLVQYSWFEVSEI